MFMLPYSLSLCTGLPVHYQVLRVCFRTQEHKKYSWNQTTTSGKPTNRISASIQHLLHVCVCVCAGCSSISANMVLHLYHPNVGKATMAKDARESSPTNTLQQEDKHTKISIPLPSGATNSLAISYSNVTIKENIFNKGCPRLYVFPPSLHPALLHQPRFWEFADESCRPQVDAWIILAAILGAVQGEGQTTRLRLARQEDGFHQAAHGLKGCRRWLSWIAWLRDCFGHLF